MMRAGLPAPSGLLFSMMAGFIVLAASMHMRWYYALIGAIAWGFSSYFIIIIGAGHLWKFITLAYVPPVIGGSISWPMDCRWSYCLIVCNDADFIQPHSDELLFLFPDYRSLYCLLHICL